MSVHFEAPNRENDWGNQIADDGFAVIANTGVNIILNSRNSKDFQVKPAKHVDRLVGMGETHAVEIARAYVFSGATP